MSQQESLFAVEGEHVPDCRDDGDVTGPPLPTPVRPPPSADSEVEVETDLGATSDRVAAPPTVEVVRSARRRRTVSARRVGDRIIVSVPARMTRAEERRWVEKMVERILASERRRRPSDRSLADRATVLSGRYLGGRAVPSSVRWVDNMAARWGSCTVSDATIRLSRRLEGMPDFVVDYVLLHELVHLLVPSHGPPFWHELRGYDRLERARGFLDGVAFTESAASGAAAPTDID